MISSPYIPRQPGHQHQAEAPPRGLLAGNETRRCLAEALTIVLVDSHPIRQHSISRLLQECGMDAYSARCNVLPVATPGAIASWEAEQLDAVDLLLLSIGGAGVDEPTVRSDLVQLGQLLPDIPVVFVSDRTEPRLAVEALRQGASGYIPTTLPPVLLVEILRMVHAGNRFLPEAALTSLLRGVHVTGTVDAHAGDTGRLEGLSPRQQQVLEMMRRGEPNKVIAHHLRIRESTVKVHVRKIMQKLRAVNRTHAAFLAAGNPSAGDTGAAQNKR